MTPANISFNMVMISAPVGVLLLALATPFGWACGSIAGIPALTFVVFALLPTLAGAAAGCLYAGQRKRKLWGGGPLQVLGAAALTTLAGALVGGLVYSVYLLGAQLMHAAGPPAPSLLVRLVVFGPFVYGSIALLMAATSWPALLWWAGTTYLAARIARKAAPEKD